MTRTITVAATALRIVAGTAAVLLTTAASPPSAAYLITGSGFYADRTETTPPRRLSTSYTAAPVPNSEVSAPAAARASSQASVSPSLFSPRNAYHGEGYVPGSTVQTQQEKRVKPAPGINLSVPLQ